MVTVPSVGTVLSYVTAEPSVVAVTVEPALPVASVYELMFIGIDEPSIASSAGLDIV